MKKILICDIKVPFSKGGAEGLQEDLYSNLIGAGFTVDRILLPFSWASRTELLKAPFLWRSIQIEPSYDLLIAKRFPSYCIKSPRKVVWLEHQYRGAYELFGNPKYSLLQEGNPLDEELRKTIHRIDNKCLSECLHRFTNSVNVASRLKRNNGLDAEVLYPPSPLQGLRYREVGDFVFLPSRLEANKRPELLIETMKLVRTPVKCVIAGEGGMKTDLEGLIKDYKLSSRVSLIGRVSDDEIINLYARCLAVVYPPFDEDFGFVTIEAFCSMKPVITMTDSGGPLEFVEDGKNGYVSENPERMAQRIDSLFVDRERARQLGQNGFHRFRKANLNWEYVIERITSFV